ncbi:ThiF family adenylyltransferase [Myxococcus sp. K38C18041901]|uniref:ThiF family adenylyltransferase n=1 Tax=Myxococcus guangdongensis TaxID=2906760 RepID=UPI0020A7C836|nr:ThiF family adenylyltransferase [Myxococcus guangdongensis]MCP3065061.1 ThiF family adenylyltransferase [Myxococcus guangdongensis]
MNEGRFSRFELIDWWDQPRLSRARVLVAGAGALGNEVLKNLSLLGVGQVVVVDMDVVETSNLSRSPLFRPSDAGRAKVDAVADGARAIHPDLRVRPLRANVVHDLGLGLFRWADVVVGALDNREARLTLNRACYRVGRAWIDGAIEVLSGVARVFTPPEGPCYECTMSEQDWRLLERRRSCSLLNRQLEEQGKVPTTPTTASVIAAIQCQEAVKLLHGQPTLAGSGFVFDGLTHQSYVTRYQRNPECLSHDPLQAIEPVARSTLDVRAREALGWARAALGSAAVLEFGRELLHGLECPGCGREERVFRSLSQVTEAEGVCPACGARRSPRLFHGLRGDEDFLDLTLAQLGVPAWDVVVGRVGERVVGFELCGDRARVLGELDEEGV